VEGLKMFKVRIYRKDFLKMCRGCSYAEITTFINKFNVEIMEG
jgi:hypothetical protein